VAYCLYKREKLFHTDIRLFHGFIVGLLFGLEFACIYLGLFYTDATRSVTFLYTSPFVVAIGAHFFLKGDRLTVLKLSGLILAFVGILVVFYGKPTGDKTAFFIGDGLALLAAVLWGATTLYIKKFMAEKVAPINTFIYQLVFSIPILLFISFLREPRWIHHINFCIVASLFYQSVIVAFMSYLVWFKLIHNYPVSSVTAFTFLTPIFGVLFGIFLLKEELTISLIIGLPLVCMGVFLVNWHQTKDDPVKAKR